MTAAQLLAFVGVVALGAMSPGPDFAVVVRRSALFGRRHGMAAAAGVAAGVSVWAFAAATGVVALLTVVPALLTVIKLAGAAYLGYLGARALWSAARGGGLAAMTHEHPAGVRASAWLAFRDGALCNALNPKAAVFFMALLPQFLPTHPGPIDALLLSLVAVAITLAWFLTVANLIAALSRFFARRAVRRAVDGATGAVLITLGARLALTTSA